MRGLFRTGVVPAILVFGATAASAATITIDITFNENCNAVFTNVTAHSQEGLACALQPDAGPGGLNAALTYDLGDPPSLTAGDLLVDDSHGNLVDEIRFDPTETITGIGGATNTGVLVYYRAAGPTLADIGFPTSNYANIVTVIEGPPGNYAYTPTVGQPGYIGPLGDSSIQVTYGIGDQSPTPEPASAMLMFGAIGILAGGKFLRTTRAARV